jgi:NAD(P)-dependent dehydrogenase (short-subunit alcohol dehydrogenase family)
MRLEALAASGPLVELAEEIAARGAAVIIRGQELLKEREEHQATQEKLAEATKKIAALEKEIGELKLGAKTDAVVADLTSKRAEKKASPPDAAE